MMGKIKGAAMGAALGLLGAPALAQTPVYESCIQNLNDLDAVVAAYQTEGWSLATASQRIRAQAILGENYDNLNTYPDRIETMGEFIERSRRWMRNGSIVTEGATVLISGDRVLSLMPILDREGAFTCVFAAPDFPEVAFPEGTEPFSIRSNTGRVGAFFLENQEIDLGNGRGSAIKSFVRHELGPDLAIQTMGAEMIVVHPLP